MRKRNMTRALRNLPLHIMLLPSVITILVFSYIPLFGIVMAFQQYLPTKGILGSKWVGLKNFIYLCNLPNTFQVLFNTLYISGMKIVAFIAIPVLFALLLNEVKGKVFKNSVQTLVYMPHFISWVIMGGILIEILSPSDGVVNKLIMTLGFKSVFFLGDAKWFPYVLVGTDIIKEFGFEAIIYLAALTSIDPTLYEAATIDGAGKFQQTWHITLPGIMPTVILLSTISMGYILNAGFDQVFNLLSPIVTETGDIIDTFIYRLGIVNAQYSVATAVGLFKSLVSMFFIVVTYKLAARYAGYRVF